MKIKMQAAVVDDDGNEQPVEVFFDTSWSSGGNILHGSVVTEHGDDIGTFEMAVKPPFKPTPDWKQWEEKDEPGIKTA